MAELIEVRGTKLVGVTERGYRVGEDHQCARLSNHEIDLIRELADPSDGSRPMPQRLIAEKFEISRGTVSDIVTFRRRASYPAGWRRVKLTIASHDIIHDLCTCEGKAQRMRSDNPVRVDHDPADND